MNTWYEKELEGYRMGLIIAVIVSLIIAFFWQLISNSFFEKELSYPHCWGWIIKVLAILWTAFVLIEIIGNTIYFLVLYRRYHPYGPNWSCLYYVIVLRKTWKQREGSNFSERVFIENAIKPKNWPYLNEQHQSSSI